MHRLYVSRPLRARELKHMGHCKDWEKAVSRPLRARELKPLGGYAAVGLGKSRAPCGRVN